MPQERIRVVNVRICTPHRMIGNGSVLIEDGVIRSVEPSDEQGRARHQGKPETAVKTIDGRGGLMIPGFIDLHVHGGGGFDVMNGRKEDILEMSRYHASFGTTAFLPTTLSAERKTLEKAVAAAAEAMQSEAPGADIVGIHLEGPYLNPKCCGAQNPEAIRAGSVEELASLSRISGGNIRLITVAPEMPGVRDVIRWAAEQGITVSIGHSEADGELVEQAVEWGVTHVTHLFNGMPPFHHRNPGTAGAVLLSERLTAELICDGVHVHPQAVSLAFRVKSGRNIVFVTDCISAAGLPEGEYRLGGLPVRLKDGMVRLIRPDGTSGNLAGSSLNMHQALLNGMKFANRPLMEILPVLTVNPARQIGIQDRKGSLEPGKDADFLLLDDRLQLKATYVRGKPVYRGDEDKMFNEN